MRVLLFLLFLSMTVCVTMGQERGANESLISRKIASESKAPQKYKGGLYALYKNHISRQILNDCVYDHSCSTFGKDAFKHFGPVKGLFLTCDRLTRCNRASLAEMRSSQLNQKGRAIDHWDHYVKVD